MKLWTVTDRGPHGYLGVHVVRAATADDAIAFMYPWDNHITTAEPLTYEGESGVIVSDDR